MNMTDAEKLEDYNRTLAMLPDEVYQALLKVSATLATGNQAITAGIMDDLAKHRVSGLVALLCALHTRNSRKILLLEKQIKFLKDNLEKAGLVATQLRVEMLSKANNQDEVVRINFIAGDELSGRFVWLDKDRRWISQNAQGKFAELLDLTVDESLQDRSKINYQLMLVAMARALNMMGNNRIEVEQVLKDISKSYNHEQVGMWSSGMMPDTDFPGGI